HLVGRGLPHVDHGQPLVVPGLDLAGGATVRPRSVGPCRRRRRLRCQGACTHDAPPSLGWPRGRGAVPPAERATRAPAGAQGPATGARAGGPVLSWAGGSQVDRSVGHRAHSLSADRRWAACMVLSSSTSRSNPSRPIMGGSLALVNVCGVVWLAL